MVGLKVLVEAEGKPAPKFDTATTCLTRPSRRVTRSLRAAFSALSWSIGEKFGMTGLTSSTGTAGTSAGGGCTAERLIPPVGGTREEGIPRSAAREKTAWAGEGSRVMAEGIGVVSFGSGLAEVLEEEPFRRSFSSSSSFTLTSSHARWAFR